ncbi:MULTISPECIES: hypothetical protein [unclassified Ensifer]|uniref:hypothetical protein n=1 Tax=unclassified Ensifer TaxID=2633371 RepID=UPI001FCD0438|nr:MULTISPECIES: hypothetical protein [unclassified Ensifer]
MRATVCARLCDTQHDVEPLHVSAAPTTGEHDAVNIVAKKPDQFVFRQAVDRGNPREDTAGALCCFHNSSERIVTITEIDNDAINCLEVGRGRRRRADPLKQQRLPGFEAVNGHGEPILNLCQLGFEHQVALGV